MWIFFLIACRGQEQQIVPEEIESSHAELNIELVPEALDFGDVGVGTDQSAHVLINNLGEENVLIGGFGTTTDAIDVVSLNTLMIGPGRQTELLVSWHPDEVGSLFAHLYLEVGPNPMELSDRVLEVSGRADGSQLQVSVDELDFGSVTVGCVVERELTLRNEGSVDVVIEDIELEDRTWMQMEAVDDDLYGLPWTLAPGETRSLRFTFTPQAYRTIDTFLRLETNDALQPVQEIPVYAEGLIDGRQTLTWSLLPENWQYTTALFHVNEVAINGQVSGLFQQSLPTYFEVLQASGVPYRVAFILETSGEVYGSVDYIDQNDSPSQAVAIALAMLGDTRAYNDHDANLEALSNGLAENADWLVGDAPEWQGARLNMVAINNDTEQSRGYWSQHVADWQSYKDNPDDVMAHAIGGEPPRGCTFADAFTAFYDAVQATGGTFSSICGSDWTGMMRTLAEASIGSAPHFPLEGDPLLDTLQVYVDDTLQNTGWSYVAATNEIVFDDNHAPRFNTDVRVTYLTAGACE